MAYKPHERPVKPEHLDRREAKRAVEKAVFRPTKPEHLDRADKGINPGRKRGK